MDAQQASMTQVLPVLQNQSPTDLLVALALLHTLPSFKMRSLAGIFLVCNRTVAVGDHVGFHKFLVVHLL